MKRTIIAVLLLASCVVLVFTTGACGSSGGNTPGGSDRWDQARWDEAAWAP